MPLGVVVGLGSDNIVLDGDPAHPQKGHSSPTPLFGPFALARSPTSATAEHLFMPMTSYRPY